MFHIVINLQKLNFIVGKMRLATQKAVNYIIADLEKHFYRIIIFDDIMPIKKDFMLLSGKWGPYNVIGQCLDRVERLNWHLATLSRIRISSLLMQDRTRTSY